MAYDNLKVLVRELKTARDRQDLFGYLDHLSETKARLALEDFEQLLDSFTEDTTYIGDSTTDGSWRITQESDNDLKFEQLVSGTWTTRARIADDHFYANTPCPYMHDPEA